ncbi:Cyclochlorotine biosynthesis protein O [Psilocybe cubensis]|uniref:Cyclochlorotine biosynthesis protein O n=1 Tax=Psilocybe cubensis TaxID=181762 RepID=A0ACB8GP09_PSICU|nr:Cyclochlorotine biosynthesis protein O [Psilocybe cubensis]KAH9477309.1 Cyclochlorotine biosynthesis protein O [Psilocybe cubensis]
MKHTYLRFLAPASGVINYYPRLFNLSSEESMLYQGHPTPEITAAWDKITDDVRPMRIPMEWLSLVNTEDNETLVKFSEEDGGGAMASVGVLHQLHCVNLLRKATYPMYYKDDRFFTVPAEELRGHLDHCIELLRQTISCAGDVTVLTYRWKGDKPHPNFDKIHQCRRFDAIYNWAVQNAVHVPSDHIVRNKTSRSPN